MKKFSVFILLALAVEAANCFALTEKPDKGDIYFQVRDSVDYSVNPILQEDMVLFVEKGRLTFWRWDKKPVYFHEKVSAPSMALEGNKVAIAWIEKRDGKDMICLSLSQDRGENWGKVIEAFPLESLQAVKLGWFKGKVVVLAANMSKKSLSVGIFEKDDDIKWYPLDLTGIDSISNPSLAITRTGVFVFLGEKGKGNSSIVCYRFDPNRDKVYQKISVTEAVEAISFIETENQKELPEAIVKYSKDQEIRLSLFYIDIDNETFKERPIAVKEDVAFAHKTYLQDGSFAVVYSSEIPNKTRQRVFFYKAKSREEVGTTIRLDNGFDNTFAWLPVIVHDGKKGVFVIWEDSRLIRRGIFAAYSSDVAKTWHGRNILLSSRKNYSFRPVLSIFKDAFYASWLQFSQDDFLKAQLVFGHIASPEKLFAKKDAILNPEKTEKLLVKRVNDYWKYMISRNFQRTYSFYDPFFRARINYENYASKLGSIIYHGARIEGVDIKGPEATVHVKVLYEVQNLMVGNKYFSSEKQERLLHDVWIFVDNEWHKKYINPLTDGVSVKY